MSELYPAYRSPLTHYSKMSSTLHAAIEASLKELEYSR